MNFLADSVVLSYTKMTNRMRDLSERDIREDNWVAVAIIAVAVVIALGIGVAWWHACRRMGMYPALDMPSINQGGTWKVYCKP